MITGRREFVKSAAMLVPASALLRDLFGQEAEPIGKLLVKYECQLPIYFDAGGKYAGVLTADNKIRLRTYDLGSSKDKEAFLLKPTDIDTGKFIIEISTKGNENFGEGGLDGYKGLTISYKAVSNNKEMKDEVSGKGVIDLYREFYEKVAPEIKKCKEKK